MVVREDAVLAQVERILHSEAFHNAEALRRLLRFLADKSVSGEADQLKEYAIGIDALGKPPTYDPRHDSVVRIQVGRLRQKLSDYYRGEGKDDPIVIDLPKGRFKLSWEDRGAPAAVQSHPEPAPVPAAPPQAPARTRGTGVLAAVAVAALLWGAIATVQLFRERRTSSPFRTEWTPELKALWQPFVSSRRPVLVSFSTPLFVGLQGAGYFRDLSVNDWEDVEKSEQLTAIRKALKSPQAVPSYNYARLGAVMSVYQLGKLFALSNLEVSLVRSSRLSWQQLSDNNVVLIETSPVFADLVRGLPVDLPISREAQGIRSRNAQGGEEMFADDYPLMINESAPLHPIVGEVYAIVTHAPGPMGSGDVLSFSSNHSPGTVGAVKAFTSPRMASTIAAKLRERSGEIPKYYQIVLKVNCRDEVPTDISYILHREIQARGVPAGPIKK